MSRLRLAHDESKTIMQEGTIEQYFTTRKNIFDNPNSNESKSFYLNPTKLLIKLESVSLFYYPRFEVKIVEKDLVGPNAFKARNLVIE